MDRIKEMLSRIGELSDQELTELEGLVLSEFDTAEKADVTAESVDTMSQLADALDSVRSEATSRAEAAAELSRRVEEVKARVKGAEPTEEVGEEGAAPEEGEAAADAEDNGPGGDGGADEASEPHAFVDANGDGKCDVCGAAADAPIHKGMAASAEAAEAEAEAPAAEAPAADAPQPDADPTVDAQDEVAPSADLTDAAAAPAADAPQTNADPEASAAESTSTTNTGEDKSEEPVTASANPEAGEPVVTAPADRLPVPKATATVAITAGADIPGISAGSALPDLDAVANAMAQRMHQMRRTAGGDGEQHTVATLVASFPEDRTLKSGGSGVENAQKIEAVVAPQAIAASGGICAPVQINYDLFGVGDLGRPVKDALPSFNADRGGIRFLTPPTLTDLAGAVSLWTLQDDIDAATDGAPDPVKPCLRVQCGEEITVYTDAIPLCLTFGNMGARAFPELVARHNELALIQQARFAETRLLTRIGALSTQVTAGTTVSTAIDFFWTIDRALASYRNRHRISNLSPMRLMLPEWFQSMLRADLAARMPGDGIENNLAATDAVINKLFAARNVNVTWFMDGEAGQVFGAQGAGAVQNWPSTLVWYLFAEGTFLFLDGGTLDLGLVRDSTLNGTNDYKMFVETFEGVAKVGLEALRVAQTVKVSGMVAGTVNTLAL